MLSVKIIDNGLTPEDFNYLKAAIGFQKIPISQVTKALENGLFNVAAKGKEAFYEKLGFVSRPNSGCGAGMEKRVVL